MKKHFSHKVLAIVLTLALLVSGTAFTANKTQAGTIKTDADFTAEAVDKSDTVCTLKFKANNYAQYVIAHIKVNDGGLQNVMMSSSDGYNFSYDVGGLSKGSKIAVSFTYNKGNAQYDTSEATYITGSSSNSGNSNVVAPFGLVAENRGNNQIGVVWGNGGAESYNIYIDNVKQFSSIGCAYYVIAGVPAGEHTISVTANSGSNESAKTSVKVTVTGSQSAATTKAPTTAKATTKAQSTSGVVTVYQDINYGGNAVSLDVGDYNMNDLIAKGFKNDDMSSIKVADGYQAIIYWDINFGGASKTITSNTSWIGSDWNDQMTSIKVMKKTTATTAKATTKAPTTAASNTGWTVVPASADKVFYKDVNHISIVNVQRPGFASADGVYATTSTAIDHININGSRASSSQVAIQGAGAIVYLSAIASSDTKIQYCDGNNNVIGSVTYKNTAGSSSSSGGGSEPSVTTKASSSSGGSGSTGGVTFTTDSSLAKPFGLVLTNPDDGIISVVWGAGTINCYNVYVDGVRKRTKVQAGVQQIPVQKAGKHTVSIATVSGTRESEWTSMDVNVVGTAPEETTDYPIEKKPQRDTSLQKKSGKMILQMNNKTKGKYSNSQIYWTILGKDSSDSLCYLDTNGNLVRATTGLNNATINGRSYSKTVIHTMAEKSWVDLPAMSSGRMYISYGEPVYINFVQGADGKMGYAGPDVNNTSDPNANTLFEYFEFTTEAVNGGITFHGNTTRVDFFSFPYMIRLMDEYGGFDRCVGDIGTRDEIFNAYKNEVPAAFRGLANDKRIMAPCKTLFNTGQQYGNYFQDYIDRFWSKYTNEDLVFSCEGGTFRGRVEGNRMRFTKDGAGAYYVSKPNTQEVLEGKGALAQGSVVEKVIEAQLCAAFNRGVAMTPQNYNKPSTYYKTDSIYNAYAGFFHSHSVSAKAYGFCYDDVNDQSTLVETGNADALVIDLNW